MHKSTYTEREHNNMQFSWKILFTFCFFCFLPIIHTKCPTVRPCPSVTLLGDTTRPEVVQKIISDTMLGLWTRPKPFPSKKADRLANVLVDMFGSDNCEWQNVTQGATYFYWIFVPRINSNPSLCPYAALAEATIADCCETTKKAIQRVPAAFSITGQLVAASALGNSGCGNSSYTAPPESCPNEGRTIDIDSLIEKIHGQYPDEFLHALKDICRSKKIHDQIMCVTTAANTLRPLRQLIAKFREETKLSYFLLFQSPLLPKLCCPDFRRQVDYLLKRIDADVLHATNQVLKELPC